MQIIDDRMQTLPAGPPGWISRDGNDHRDLWDRAMRTRRLARHLLSIELAARLLIHLDDERMAEGLLDAADAMLGLEVGS